MKKDKKTKVGAVTSPTLFVESGGIKVAYRSIGEGRPMLVCNRFRGILDTWDPAFIDRLAGKFRVIVFDYPGIGLSEGKLPHTISAVAEFVKLFAETLNLSQFILAGWSYGGTVAQTFAANYPENITHLVIIASGPPGKNENPAEQVFFDAALKPENDFNDELVLFFEPESKASRKAAKESYKRIRERMQDLSVPVSPERFDDYFKGGADYKQDKGLFREKLASSKIPFLVICGDHDPSFPVENWYPMVRIWKSAQLLILPDSGHAPQHQYPKLTARYISAFVRST